MRHTYTVSFSTSSGTHGEYAGFSSLRSARRAAIEMTRGNCASGDRATWRIYRDADDTIVAEGTVR